jgi:hypothetical protein
LSPATSPTTYSIVGVTGSSATDVWLVSYFDVIRWNGVGYFTLDTGTSSSLYDGYAASSGNAYFVGDYGTVLHFKP